MLIKYNTFLLVRKKNKNKSLIFLKLCIDSKEPLIHLLFSLHIEIYYGKNYEKTIHYNTELKYFQMLFEDENNEVSEIRIWHHKKYKSFVKLLKSYVNNNNNYYDY